MPAIHREVFIQAPADRIDDLLVDPAHAHEVWGADSARPEGDWPQPNGKLHTVVKIAGIPIKATITTLEHVRGERHRQRVEGMLDATMAWAFTPRDGGTELAVDMDYEVPGGVLGPALDKLMFERSMNKTADDVVAAAKRLAES